MGLTPDELDKLESRMEKIDEERDAVDPGPAGMAAEAHHSGRYTALEWVRETFAVDEDLSD